MTQREPELVLGPSGAGTVVLDLGPGVGALILDVPAGLAGREIEISPAGGGAGVRRTHSMVRERRTGGGTHYAAVYPDLAVGDYTIWQDAVTPGATITVSSGQVTRCRFADRDAAVRPAGT
jgi:hypothetical protein